VPSGWLLDITIPHGNLSFHPHRDWLWNIHPRSKGLWNHWANESPGYRSRSLRASPVVLSMWPCKNIFHIQVLVICFFATPPIKSKLGQQISGVLLPIANHLDQSLWWANQKQWPEVRSYLLHSFLQVHIVAAAPCTTHGRVCNYIEPRLFSEPNRHIFLTFLHPILLWRITYSNAMGLHFFSFEKDI
jgi:hypothetical protein